MQGVRGACNLHSGLAGPEACRTCPGGDTSLEVSCPHTYIMLCVPGASGLHIGPVGSEALRTSSRGNPRPEVSGLNIYRMLWVLGASGLHIGPAGPATLRTGPLGNPRPRFQGGQIIECDGICEVWIDSSGRPARKHLEHTLCATVFLPIPTRGLLDCHVSGQTVLCNLSLPTWEHFEQVIWATRFRRT